MHLNHWILSTALAKGRNEYKHQPKPYSTYRQRLIFISAAVSEILFDQKSVQSERNEVNCQFICFVKSVQRNWTGV